MGVLQAENVTYQYKTGTQLTLKGISCTFEPGLVTAVVGPSGSGKTTLLSVLAGLDRPTEGRVLLDGADLSEMDPDQYRREAVSVIFQAFQLFPLLTVLENVCFPMELAGVPVREAAEQAKALLNKVGIGEEKWKRYPAHLSGGEQQRVAISRSLATRARVLLADEPTGNLDEENSRNVVELLTRLAHEDGYCVIIVTHDPTIAQASDRVYHMADGVLTQVK